MLHIILSCNLFFLSFLTCFFYIVSSFSVEELKHINYEVDISEVPVNKKELNHPALHITSKSGQEFQCLLPQLNEEEVSEKEVINDKDADVTELLNPLKSKACLYKNIDWWTYEFCYGLYIKQFHIEDGQVIGQILTLGLYESDYDWKNETNQQKFKNAKQRYHSQYYANGTKCDLTGQPRQTEVRFICEEDSGDYMYRVDEPGTCSYVITIHTSRICSHPLLKPVMSKKAHSIACHPLLSEEEYSDYLQKLNEEKAQAEEKRSQWLNNQQEQLQMMKDKNKLTLKDHSFEIKVLKQISDSSVAKDGHDILKDKDTDQFRLVIMAVLTDQQEAIQEIKRQKKLEDNYKFKWVHRKVTNNKEE